MFVQVGQAEEVRSLKRPGYAF